MKKTKIMTYVLSDVDISTIPTEIKILPLGDVVSRKGNFEVDNESCESIIKQFKSRQLDLVIDYEHQTLENTQAPASGWIKELYKGVDALIAKVEWTDRAKEYLKNREYRYLSPVVLVRQRDNKAIILHSVALTNTPAIDGMFAIVNSDDLELDIIEEKEGEQIMELDKLIKLLGLEEGATEEDVATALGEMIAKGKEDKTEKAGEETIVANKTVLDLLGLPAGAKTDDVTAKIMSFKVGGEDVVARLKELEEASIGRKAEDLVTKALKDGKISANQKDWAMDYAKKDAEGFVLFAAKSPAVVPVGKIGYTKEEPLQTQDLNMMALKNLGVSAADLKAYSGGNEDE